MTVTVSSWRERESVLKTRSMCATSKPLLGYNLHRVCAFVVVIFVGFFCVIEILRKAVVIAVDFPPLRRVVDLRSTKSRIAHF